MLKTKYRIVTKIMDYSKNSRYYQVEDKKWFRGWFNHGYTFETIESAKSYIEEAKLDLVVYED